MGPPALLPAFARLLVATALAVSLSGSLSGCLSGSASRESLLLQADRDRIAAMLEPDPDGLYASFHESLTYAHSNGVVDSKTSLLRSLVAARMEYRSIEPVDPQVRIRDDTGIVTARARIEVATGREVQQLEIIYTATYWYQSGRWQLAAYHSSPAP